MLRYPPSLDQARRIGWWSSPSYNTISPCSCQTDGTSVKESTLHEACSHKCGHKWMLDVLPEVDDAPHVSPKPHRGPTVRLVLADQDRMRNWKQSNQRTMLEELEDLRLVCQTSVTTTQIWTSVSVIMCHVWWRKDVVAHPILRCLKPGFNYPSWRVTGFHYRSTLAVLTGARFH